MVCEWLLITLNHLRQLKLKITALFKKCHCQMFEGFLSVRDGSLGFCLSNWRLADCMVKWMAVCMASGVQLTRGRFGTINMFKNELKAWLFYEVFFS